MASPVRLPRRPSATIVSRIYRPEPAAASLFLGTVADALMARGYRVDVLTVRAPREQGDGSRGERISAFPVLRDRNGYVRGYLQYLSFDVPLALRLLFARRPDVVLVEPPPTTGAVVRAVCALRRIPYVYDAADIWSDAAGHATDSGLVVRVLRRIETFALRGATALVTISQGVEDRLAALRVTTPVTVTGFGADTSTFSYEQRSIEPLFIYAGTYTALHGADLIIEAFARLRESHPEHRLRFIGNGTGQDEMRARAAALGIAGRVEFRDPVTAADLRPQLAAATASLATLHPDGGYEYAFTSKIFSSLATGCPVIFAGVGPTRTFIDDAEAPVGTAVGYEVDALATAMRGAADDPLPAPERQALAEWTAAHHSMRATAERVCDVLDAAHERGSEQ